MSRLIFESAIEKIGRILASQYHIDVLFEGNEAYTDGKEVVLPYIENLTDEIKGDLHGYLDHEIGHCKFTTFGEMKKCKIRFHRELLNAAEDVRIEREMQDEFPGTALNIDPLNTKLEGKLADSWDKLPWPIRTILGIRDIMLGKEPKIEEDTKRYIDAAREDAIKLNDCKDTVAMRELTEKITKIITDEYEEQKKEEGKGDKGMMGECEDGDDEKKGDKKKSKSKGGKECEGEGDDKDGEMIYEPCEGRKSRGDKDKSKWDEHITDVTKLINEELKDAIKKDKVESDKGTYDRYKISSRPHIPATTRFDKVTDHSGKGQGEKYGKLKREVMKHIAPIKRALERVLKVKENAKWSPEKERGTIDNRSLAKMASSKSYRTVFKEFTKTETNNVAVELLCDMSGSMSGKVETAKKAMVAIGEAMKDLGIAFEVTGFNSEKCHEVAEFSRRLPDMPDTRRFNRYQERLDLHVFKSFDCPYMNGIVNLTYNSENPDGECVSWAAKRLAARSEKRKILIVFSDGLPATSDGDHNVLAGDLKRKVKLIEKSGIEVIGFGIATHSVEQFYEDSIVINNISDLPKVTLGKLAKMIAEGT